MIALPAARPEPYSLPGHIDLMAPDVPGILLSVAPWISLEAVDWGSVRSLSRSLVVKQTRTRLEVALGAAPDPVVKTIYRGAPTSVQALLLEAHAFGSTEQAAVVLVCAWQDPKWQKVLSEPAWKRTLNPLTETADPHTKAATRKGDRVGWVRAELVGEVEASRWDSAGGRVRAHLILLGKQTGEPLKPKPLATEEALVSQLAEPRPSEVLLASLIEQHSTLWQPTTFRRNKEPIARIDAEIFRLLGDLREVVFERRPVTVHTEPWPARLVLEDGPGGGLRPVWADTVSQVWRVGSGWLLDARDGLWPVAPEHTHLLDLFKSELPRVPRDDLYAFVEAIVLRSQVPIELKSAHLQPRSVPPEPHLVLTARDGVLTVDVRYGYGDALAGTGDLVLDSKELYRRDREEESTIRAEAEDLLHGPLPRVYSGEAVYDFLLDTLPHFDGWTIDADRALLRSVRGGMKARVHFESGLDWFNLDVELEVDGQSVPLQRALAAWRTGSRWVSLKDGSMARLPQAWLERYGQQAQELEKLGTMRQGRRRLGVAQVLVADELLGQAEGSEDLLRWQQQLATIRSKIKSFDGITPHPVPRGVQAQLRDYQRQGFRWMSTLAELGLGGVLADDMGLGKTLQSLVWLQHAVQQKPKGGPALVVAPTSVIHNWAAEAAHFTPNLRVHVHHGPARGALPTQVDLVVTSYSLLVNDLERFTTRRWRAVLLDEAQNIKNPQSARAQAARRLEADQRFCLTGTPLENHLAELWSLFEFALPGFFGSLDTFVDTFARPVQEGDQAALTRLRARIRPFVLRRLKSEVASELPPRTEQVITCTLGKAQRVLYESIREAYRESVLKGVAERGVGGATLQVLEALTRLRQACCDPSLVPLPQARGVLGSAKRTLLTELLENLIAEGRRALVFSQWPSFLALVRSDLEAAGHAHLYLDGATRERGLLQARWNQPDGPPVFLISIKAGGTGLNLTGADVVIHLDPWWNPAVEDQATDRAHRIGQGRPVTVYKLVSRDTVEEKLVELQARKRALFNATVNEERLLGESLTREDLEAVFAPSGAVDIEEEPGAAAELPAALEANAPQAEAPAGDEAAPKRKAATRKAAASATAASEAPANPAPASSAPASPAPRGKAKAAASKASPAPARPAPASPAPAGKAKAAASKASPAPASPTPAKKAPTRAAPVRGDSEFDRVFPDQTEVTAAVVAERLQRTVDQARAWLREQIFAQRVLQVGRTKGTRYVRL